MSQFLGPIHHVMYGKILLVHGWEEACIARANESWGEERVTNLLAPVSAKRWCPESGELAALIGDHPIHDWLQTAVNHAETSLAAVVATLESGGDDAGPLLRSASHEHGHETALRSLESASANGAAMEALPSVLGGCYLDGMPCDQVSEMVEGGSERLVVRRLLEIHRNNWIAGGADLDTMIDLQGVWSSGLASGVSDRIRHHREIQPVAGMLACTDTFIA